MPFPVKLPAALTAPAVCPVCGTPHEFVEDLGTWVNAETRDYADWSCSEDEATAHMCTACLEVPVGVEVRTPHGRFFFPANADTVRVAGR